MQKPLAVKLGRQKCNPSPCLSPPTSPLRRGGLRSTTLLCLSFLFHTQEFIKLFSRWGRAAQSHVVWEMLCRHQPQGKIKALQLPQTPSQSTRSEAQGRSAAPKAAPHTLLLPRAQPLKLLSKKPPEDALQGAPSTPKSCWEENSGPGGFPALCQRVPSPQGSSQEQQEPQRSDPRVALPLPGAPRRSGRCEPAREEVSRASARASAPAGNGHHRDTVPRWREQEATRALPGPCFSTKTLQARGETARCDAGRGERGPRRSRGLGGKGRSAGCPCSHLTALLQPQERPLKPGRAGDVSRCLEGGDTRRGQGSALPWHRAWVLWSSTHGRAMGAQGMSCCPLLGCSMEQTGTRRILSRTSPPRRRNPTRASTRPSPKTSRSSPGGKKVPPPSTGTAGPAPPGWGLRSGCQVSSCSNVWPRLPGRSPPLPVCSESPSCRQAKSSGGS